MPPKTTLAILIVIGLPCPIMAADDKDKAKAAKPKVNYQDHVAAIFQSRCNACHNADKQKGGLALESFGATLQGGGSGKVIEPGDPSGSHLWNLVTHAEEPKMPPNGPKIPEAELDLIKQWIEGGAPETSGSVVAIKEKPKFEFKLDPSAMGKPVGPPAMPEEVSTEPSVLSPRPNAIVALAASPWAPLVAVAGHKQILLYHATNRRLIGVFPFPEGTVHVLKFSRNGALLLAGGGRGGQSGLAVAFDVKTGKRAFSVGKEYDVVLAADISPDHGQVALGGPSKVVRVYGTADGQLQFEMKKHTEWITAMEFSPDGVLLATGDRNNGLVVWEAQTGREFFDLRGHTAAISDITWRLDSNVVASAAEDGTVRLWEMENGTPVKSWAAHGGGVASARFARDGRIVTAGRDRSVRAWGQDGSKQSDFEAFGDLALRAVFAADDSRVVAGDWSGEVRVWDSKDGARLGNLAANPEPVAARLAKARAALVAAESAANEAAKGLAPLVAALADKDAALLKAQPALAAAEAEAATRAGAVATLKKADAERAAALASAESARKAAQSLADKAKGDRLAAEKAVGDTASAEKSAIDALSSSKGAIDKALNEKVAQDQALASAVDALKSAGDAPASATASAALSQAVARSAELSAAVAASGRRMVDAQVALEKAAAAKGAAPGLLLAADSRLKQAEAAIPPARAAVDRANSARVEAAKALADARSASQAAKGSADDRKAELAAAEAARAEADKALNARRPAVDALAARAAEVRSEVDSLAAEIKNRSTATASAP